MSISENWLPDQPNLVTFIIDDDSGVEVPGLGTAWTIELSVAGGAFVPALGTKGEIGYGWYSYVTTAGEADSSITGSRALRITHASARQQNLEYTVEPRVTGSVKVEYTVKDSDSGLGLASVRSWVTAEASNSDNPFWLGYSDVAGVLKDALGNLPRLPTGVLYLWKHHPGFIDDLNPHIIDTGALTTFEGTMTAIPAVVVPDEDAGPATPAYIFATPDDFMKYWFWDFGDEQNYEQLWPLLRMGASRIMAALSSSDQADCSKDEWAMDYLRELNIIIAGTMLNSPAVRMSNEQRALYSVYVNEALVQIRDGDIQLCDGATGKMYPSWETARYGLTDRNTARVIVQDAR